MPESESLQLMVLSKMNSWLQHDLIHDAIPPFNLGSIEVKCSPEIFSHKVWTLLSSDADK